MNQVRLFVRGRVQGVGFRQFVRAKAHKLMLTGWVQNLSDGRVEVLARGPHERLSMLITDCNRGPVLAEVEDVEVRWEELGERMQGFTIRQLS
ncbi:MAG TPA: acylphosphatase [Patescibacteria group bacterium]|nr:acylphosphatase [Patescibacteria group bacterium]